MQQIIKGARCTGERPIILSYVLNTRRAGTTSIQMVATAIDQTQPAQADGWLQGSNDRVVWINIANLKTDGNGTQIDGGPFEALWEAMRFRLEQTNNCKVDVFLAQKEN